MIITLPMPPSINRTYKTGNGRFFKSREAHAWQDECLMMLLKYRRQKLHFTGRFQILIDLYYFRNSDIDSRIKAILDVLQQSGIIDNDMNCYALNVIKHIDPANPRVEIEVSSL